MRLFRNISQAVTLQGASEKEGRRVLQSDLSIIAKAAVLEDRGKIVWLGPEKSLPKALAKNKKLKEIDLDKKTVLPGFVECHTHLVFAGSRADEFELKNNGATYQEIAARGGGILSTMKATRAASEKALLATAQTRVQEFVRQGVTTLEVKSGYALNLKDELKTLKVINQLNSVTVVPTFLGAHALPPEFKTYEEYLDFLAQKVLPEVKKKKLSQRVDIFIENGFFSAVAGRKFLEIAKDMGFQITIHADQITLSGGTGVALDLQALSADHVIQLDEQKISQVAKSNLTAVLLPAADLYMKCAYPKARKLIDAGARVALATDFNPGTSPTQDLSLVGLLARLEMKMSLPEVMAAYSVGAAYALGLQDQKGSLQVGKDCDLAVMDGEITNLFYSAGKTPVVQTYSLGRKA